MLVRVNMLSQFLMSYVVEIDDNDPIEYAADTVVMNEDAEGFREFSQKHLGSTYLDCRKVTLEDAIEDCKKELGYIDSWSDEQVIKNCINLKKD